MYQEISKLLMYGDLSQDEILYKLGQLFEQFEVGEYNKTELVRDINTQVKRILKVATDYGFDDNLWHNYLTFFLMMSENPFSITVMLRPVDRPQAVPVGWEMPKEEWARLRAERIRVCFPPENLLTLEE